MACQNDGVPGSGEDLPRPCDLGGRGRFGPYRVDLQGGQRLRGAIGFDVLRHGQEHGAGAFTLCDLERLACHLRHRVRTLDAGRPLGDGSEHRHQVDDLVRLLVDTAKRPLGGQSHQRRAVGHGVRGTEQQVDRTGPQGGRTHSRPAGEPPVDLRHERGSLLVAHQDVADPGSVERVDEPDVLLTGDPEDVLHALGPQTPHQQMRDVLHRCRVPRLGRTFDTHGTNVGTPRLRRPTVGSRSGQPVAGVRTTRLQ
ncbi:hypothetical protein S1361_04860 [Streptomyces cyanogenus]|uniref:Uncharacterized protein n=1 Tax=Streptomyces cyanogenus TaxID=80860 RepID=A0ABX7TLH6_STRCY|nr:hypothetical protein S1361_04860 [Streptomyces cyanogenus]